MMLFMIFTCRCPKKENMWMQCVQKKAKAKNKNGPRKGAEIKFCTRQYLYISVKLGLGLGRKLYLPPLERLG